MAAEAGSGRPFVGRVETVEALHRRFEDARAGTGGVTLLVGGTGVGKSALIAELVRDIRTRGIRVMVGRALALDDPPPFSLIRSAVQSAHDDPALRSEDASPIGGDQFLIGFAPRLGEAAFPTPVGIEERLLEVLGETDERGDMSRERVLTGIAEEFLEFTRRGPTVLILEDLHRADESSLSAVEFLANQLQNRPLWILVTSRPYSSLSESGRARLEGFETATRARRIVLRPMTSGEVADYLRMSDPSRSSLPRRSLGATPRPAGTRSSSSSSTAGWPPRASPAVDRERAFLRSTRRRIERSTSRPSSARSSPSASCCGRAARTRNALPRPSTVVGQGLLFERPGNSSRSPRTGFATRSTRPHRKSTPSPSPTRRRSPRSDGQRRPHHDLRARPSLLPRSGRREIGPLQSHRGRDRRPRARPGRRSGPPFARARKPTRPASGGPRRRVGDRPRALAHDNELGRLQEAEGILRDFLDRGKDDPGLSPRGRATLEIYLARVLSDRGDWRAAAEVAQKVLSSAGLEGQLLVRLGAHRLLGEALFYEGHYPEALAQHTEEIRLAREAGNERATALGQARRASVLAMMGQSDSALVEAREAAASLERVGPARESAQAHLFLGVLIANSKSPVPHHEESIAEFAEAIRLAEKAQDPRHVGWALFNTADILREAGQFEEAVEKVQRARDILGRIGDGSG